MGSGANKHKVLNAYTMAAGQVYTPPAINLSNAGSKLTYLLQVSGTGSIKVEWLVPDSAGAPIKPGNLASDCVLTSSFTVTSGPDADGKLYIAFPSDFFAPNQVWFRFTEVGGLATATVTFFVEHD